MGQYSPTGQKNPYRPQGQRSGMQNLNNIANPFGTPDEASRGQFSRNEFDTKLHSGATSTTEQFKGLPNTGFIPGQNANVGGGLLVQQRLRLRFVELISTGLSHKDAAKQVQSETGLHARTGQRIVAKVEHTKTKKVKYAGKYATRRHYHTRTGHHPARKQSPYGTPAGLK